MKTLLVSEEENAVKNISQYLQSIGSEMICYHNVLKALDNIDEISPHLVIVDAESFPRLWKVFVQFILQNTQVFCAQKDLTSLLSFCN